MLQPYPSHDLKIAYSGWRQDFLGGGGWDEPLLPWYPGPVP